MRSNGRMLCDTHDLLSIDLHFFLRSCSPKVGEVVEAREIAGKESSEGAEEVKDIVIAEALEEAPVEAPEGAFVVGTVEISGQDEVVRQSVPTCGHRLFIP